MDQKTYKVGPYIFYKGYLDNKGFVVKNKIAKEIGKNYLNISIKLSLLHEYNDLCEDEEVYSNDLKGTKKMEWFIKYIDNILNQLPPKYLEIITNEYFLPKSNWWIKKYKRSTYFRTRLIALNEFLDYVF